MNKISPKISIGRCMSCDIETLDLNSVSLTVQMPETKVRTVFVRERKRPAKRNSLF